VIKAFITGMPFPITEPIQNIKALRTVWLFDEVDPVTGQRKYLGLKEAKAIVDSHKISGRVEVDIPSEKVLEALKASSFILEVSGRVTSSEAKMQMIAIRNLMQESIDADNIDMLEALVPAFRVGLKQSRGV
jgi:hypothetical protein